MNERGIVTLAIVGLMTMFLSLVVPVQAMGRAITIDVQMERDWPDKPVDPVLYTDFDISKALDPWEDIMVMQLAIGVYDDQKALEESLNASLDLGGWAVNSIGMSFLFTGLLAVFITFLWSVDGRKRKRV